MPFGYKRCTIYVCMSFLCNFSSLLHLLCQLKLENYSWMWSSCVLCIKFLCFAFTDIQSHPTSSTNLYECKLRIGSAWRRILPSSSFFPNSLEYLLSSEFFPRNNKLFYQNKNKQKMAKKMEKLKATIQWIITNIASSIHSFAILSFIYNLFGLSYKLQLWVN